MDTTVEKVTTWTTAFDNYISRPKTITTKNLFQQNLHHKTGHYCQTKNKKTCQSSNSNVDCFTFQH